MDPHPPSGFSNCKSCPNEPPGLPNPMHFHHPQFPQHLPFAQPSYSLNFPHQHFPQQHLYPQNVHYVVVQPQYAPFSLPQPSHPPSGVTPTVPPPPAGVTPLPAPQLPCPPAGMVPFMSVSNSGDPHSVTGLDEQEIVSVNNDVNADPDRAAKRLRWTEVEDLRMISAWLNSSELNNSEKNGVCWMNVAKLYNRSTPRDRRREAVLLKSHWSKINKKIAHFYDCWCRVKEKYATAQSDSMQLLDQTWAMFNEEARAMYLLEAKHHFAFSHFWKVVWDQPKWINYISSKRTKLSESGDYTSSSEDDKDVPEKETSQQDCMSAKKKQDGQGKVSSPSSELQEGAQCSVDPQNILAENQEEMTNVQLQRSNHKLELARLNQPQTNGKETTISGKQTELLMADSSRFHEFQQVKKELMAGTSRFNEFHRESGDMPVKQTHQQGYKVQDHERPMRGGVPEKETHQQGCKTGKSKRKRKGNTSNPSSEVREDIKRAMDLQTMLQKDREKMAEVQLLLSKENLELARIKQQEAKDKKETTLYEKYTELLTADTLRFDAFQKEEYENAVRCMGEMLFGKDGK